MIILIDTNIVLDVLLERKPFSDYSSAIFRLAEKDKIKAYLTSNSVTDIFYILRKTYDRSVIKRELLKMFGFIKILNVSEGDVLKSFEIETKDFEDAIIIQCAKRVNADYIITRDPDGYKNSIVKHLKPEDFIRQFR